MAVLALALVLLPSLALANLASTRVEIENGGYTGVVIAIHPDVEEDTSLLDSIKTIWTDASRVLYIATGNRAYFKDITILVPKSWTKGTYDYARGSENYDQADAIIAPPNPSYGNTPYTEQYEGCGKSGIRMHFTPEYLHDDVQVENFGPRGKVVVHEWAHYRWGVFDETSKENPFYWDPEYGSYNGPVATTCPRDLMGEIRDVDSNYARCSLADIDEQTNSYPESCVFFPSEDQYYPINTSMMAYHYLDEVSTFCKDADDEEAHEHNHHNIYAPNAQNSLCSMQSTWSVIKSSPDYGNWINATIGLSDIQETEPNFEIVQPQSQRFVQILDDSGSMGGSCGDVTKTECLQTAAYQFITVAAPNGSYVGMVQFADYWNVLADLTLLQAANDRETLAQPLLTLRSSGGTDIGDAILAGIAVLEKDGNSAAGGHLIVITDGEESSSYPMVKDVTDEVLAKGVIVETIFIMNDGNEDLKNLCERSGGTYYLGKSQSDLIAIFSQISVVDSTADNSFQIHSHSFYVNTANFTSATFIDATIGLNTVFSFIWATGNVAPNIIITSPGGCSFSNKPSGIIYCNGGDSSHTVNVQFKTIRFDIPGNAEVGQWTYTVEKSYSYIGEITATVSSEATNAGVEPIMIESGMSQTDVSDGEAAILYAKVTQGYNPILGASVVATVSKDGNAHTNVDLYDNGAGSDIRKGDGIYSRYFTQFTGPGRYSVEVNVRSDADATGGPTTRQDISRANYIPGFVNTDGSVNVNPNGAVSNEGDGSASVGIQSQDLGNFTRVASSGSFDYSGTVDVDSGIPAPDSFPPGRIIDLSLRQQSLSDYTDGVVLEFTAPGDDYDQGRASGYIIRYTFDDPTNLIKSFDSSNAINIANVLVGNMSDPSLAGAKETFIIETPELPVDENGNTVNNSRLAFAVKAFDDASNYGDSSNVAVINFFIAPVVIPGKASTTTTTTTTTTDASACPVCEDYDENLTFLTWLSAGLGIIAAICLTSTIILGIWLRKSNKQLSKRTKTMLKGVENMQMVENGQHRRKHWFPKVLKVQPIDDEHALDPRNTDKFDFCAASFENVK